MEPKRQKLDPDKGNETNYDIFNINDFPSEIIENIFSFLTQNQLGQIARVCRRWSVLTKSPALWKKVNVKIFCSSDREKDAQSFKSFIDGLPSCVTFIRLYFSDRARVYMHLDFEKLCIKLHHSCPHAEVLILKRCAISTILPEVINICTQFLEGLKKLVLPNCRFEDYSGTLELKENSNIEVLDLTGSHLPVSSKIHFSKLLSLKELRLAGTGVDDDWFAGDASFLNQLHLLDLGWTWVTARTFPTIQRHGQNLKELYLCNLDVFEGHLNFNPIFPHLHTICLSFSRVTCEGLVSLIRFCPSLVNAYVDERVAEYFAEHPFVVANRGKSETVKRISILHDHYVDYLYN